VVQFYAYVESFVATLKSDENEGQGMVEYALILALISVVAIALLTTIGQGIVSKLTEVNTAL
jgi:pilus assembly protein Flp/PilA